MSIFGFLNSFEVTLESVRANIKSNHQPSTILSMSKTLTRLALLSGILAVVFSLLPSILDKQKEPVERLGDTLAREGQVLVDSLLGKQEPSFELRFEGPYLWPSLAAVTGALAFVLGMIPAIAGGSDRFVSGVASLMGASVVVWQVWIQ